MKKVAYIASECVPFIKTGGLADVVGTLPRIFDKKEYDVRVIIPNYMCLPAKYKERQKELLKRNSINDKAVRVERGSAR